MNKEVCRAAYLNEVKCAIEFDGRGWRHYSASFFSLSYFLAFFDQRKGTMAVYFFYLFIFLLVDLHLAALHDKSGMSTSKKSTCASVCLWGERERETRQLAQCLYALHILFVSLVVYFVCGKRTT
jgi:hypothetical protein